MHCHNQPPRSGWLLAILGSVFVSPLIACVLAEADVILPGLWGACCRRYCGNDVQIK